MSSILVETTFDPAWQAQLAEFERAELPEHLITQAREVGLLAIQNTEQYNELQASTIPGTNGNTVNIHGLSESAHILQELTVTNEAPKKDIRLLGRFAEPILKLYRTPKKIHIGMREAASSPDSMQKLSTVDLNLLAEQLLKPLHSNNMSIRLETNDTVTAFVELCRRMNEQHKGYFFKQSLTDLRITNALMATTVSGLLYADTRPEGHGMSFKGPQRQLQIEKLRSYTPDNVHDFEVLQMLAMADILKFTDTLHPDVLADWSYSTDASVEIDMRTMP